MSSRKTKRVQKWNADGDRIVMEYSNKGYGHYFTDGQILVESDDTVKRGEQKKVDHLLLVKNNLPLALVEAKGYDHDACEEKTSALCISICKGNGHRV
jgi:type I restriction enzyme R subunit